MFIDKDVYFETQTNQPNWAQLLANASSKCLEISLPLVCSLAFLSVKKKCSIFLTYLQKQSQWISEANSLLYFFFSSHSRCVRWYLSDSVPLFCPVFPISVLYSFHINHCSVFSLTRRHLFTSLSPPLPQITANWVLLVCALRAEQCISSLQRPSFEDFKLEMGAKGTNIVLRFYCGLHGPF